MGRVLLKWLVVDGDGAESIHKSVFESAEEAQAQAEAEPNRGSGGYLGIFDYDEPGKKVADVKKKG